MIITKGVAVGEVVTLKIITGEEIIGKLTAIDDTTYSINRPLVLVAGPQGLGLQQWAFTIDPDRAFKIGKDKIIVIDATNKEMANQYLSGTSGIKIM